MLRTIVLTFSFLVCQNSSLTTRMTLWRSHARRTLYSIPSCVNMWNYAAFFMLVRCPPFIYTFTIALIHFMLSLFFFKLVFFIVFFLFFHPFSLLSFFQDSFTRFPVNADSDNASWKFLQYECWLEPHQGEVLLQNEICWADYSSIVPFAGPGRFHVLFFTNDK